MTNASADQIRRALDMVYAVEDSSVDDALMQAQLECLAGDEWPGEERRAEDETVDH